MAKNECYGNEGAEKTAERTNMEGTTGTTMATFLETLSTIVSKMFDWVGSVGTAIIADPILTFSLGVFAVGAAVGIFGRLLSRG